MMAGTLILIVEDNEKNRKLIRDVLQVKGYQTLETETAEEGHNLCHGKSSRPHPYGHPASRYRRNDGSQAASGRPLNKDHTCHCHHGISYELQPSGDVGRRV